MSDETETIARLKKASDALDAAQQVSRDTDRELSRSKRAIAKARKADAPHQAKPPRKPRTKTTT